MLMQLEESPFRALWSSRSHLLLKNVLPTTVSSKDCRRLSANSSRSLSMDFEEYSLGRSPPVARRATEPQPTSISRPKILIGLDDGGGGRCQQRTSTAFRRKSKRSLEQALGVTALVHHDRRRKKERHVPANQQGTNRFPSTSRRHRLDGWRAPKGPIPFCGSATISPRRTRY